MAATTKRFSYYQSRRAKMRINQVVVTLLLLAGSLLFLSPLWWMFATSVKSMQEIMQYPPTWWPTQFHFENYAKAWTTAPFTRFALNSLFVSAFVVVGSVLSNSLVAYGFAKMHFRGRNVLFAIVLGTMMLPGFVTLVPQYILFAKLGWLNTYLPLIIPPFTAGAFFIFLNRQFLLGIPNELLEAAKIDGASHFYIWSRLMLPLTKPVLATTAIFSFNGSWNDVLGPLLYLNEESKYTIQLGLATFKGTVQTQWHYLMAASILVLIPVVSLFFFFQKYFIEGMNLTSGTKG
ncbi:carbohydrate ABC transporter permease [Paenibacillus sp.]|uniref:carbohydrate ABC transporter permease n=1 Tax=Paenibacillus sp. TaxID=58172 RepID=UPI002D484EE1|nr:carbohydrate ABC transporter permease [Paenibacillus sp.]HZG87088.1 carbohydrate ABC transporter permease [Paenibacillus sp.]